VSDISGVLGVAALFVSLGIGGFALFLLKGRAGPQTILRAFAQLTLVPERRRRFLLLLWVEALCFLVTGVLLGLNRLRVTITADEDLLYTATFLGGMLALGALTWVGLNPRLLTEAERAAAERDAPSIMGSISMVPFRQMEEPRERNDRN